MPALALAQALQDAGKGIEPVLVGAVRGIEAQVLPRYPFRHRLLPIEPIYRRTWWKNVRWLLIAGRVWRAVGRVLDEDSFRHALTSGRAKVGLRIPPNYSDRILRGEQVQVQVLIDGSDSQVATTALNTTNLLGIARSRQILLPQVEAFPSIPSRTPIGRPARYSKRSRDSAGFKP